MYQHLIYHGSHHDVDEDDNEELFDTESDINDVDRTDFIHICGDNIVKNDDKIKVSSKKNKRKKTVF